MRPDLLAEAIDRHVADGVTPVAVVATAGTTLTGAIDLLAPIAGSARRGGSGSTSTARTGFRPLRSCPDRFAGVERADSVSVDAHKWLYVPKACSVALVRERDALAQTFAHEQGYLPHQQHEPHAAEITLEYRGRSGR